MNQSALHNLRAIYLANRAFPLDDPRARTLWRRMKRAYNKVPRNERGPEKLDAALARAMATMTPAT